MIEKLAREAPGRLSLLLSEGLRGHHLLFGPDEIRHAFAAPDEVVTREQADALGGALLAICRDPVDVARGSVAALDPRTRVALIRLYFRLLEKACADADPRH